MFRASDACFLVLIGGLPVLPNACYLRKDAFPRDFRGQQFHHFGSPEG